MPRISERVLQKALRIAFEKGRRAGERTQRAEFDALLERMTRLKELNGTTDLFAKAWDESQHRRDHGKFSSTGGTSGDVGKSGAAQGMNKEQSGDEQGNAVHPADAKAKSLLQHLKDVPRAVRERVASFVQAKYAGLVERYGETGAKAVLGATVLLLPVPVPGTSLLPVAIAEAVLKIRNAVRGAGGPEMKAHQPEMSDEELQAAAREFLAGLYAEMGEELPAGGADKATPEAEAETELDHEEHSDAFALALLEHAVDARERGDDPRHGLESIRAAFEEHDGGAGDGVIRKAWNENVHPRSDDGRFVSKDAIQAAKSDPGKAAALRERVTDPAQRKKLDAALGGETDVGRTKRGQAKHEAGQRREAKAATRARANELIAKLSDYHAKPGTVRLTAEDLHALADHLADLPLDDLKRARMALRANLEGDRRKADVVRRLTEHARGMAAGPKPEEAAAPDTRSTAQRLDEDLTDADQRSLELANRLEGASEPAREPNPDFADAENYDRAREKLDRMGQWEGQRPASVAAEEAANRARSQLGRATATPPAPPESVRPSKPNPAETPGNPPTQVATVATSPPPPAANDFHTQLAARNRETPNSHINALARRAAALSPAEATAALAHEGLIPTGGDPRQQLVDSILDRQRAKTRQGLVYRAGDPRLKEFEAMNDEPLLSVESVSVPTEPKSAPTRSLMPAGQSSSGHATLAAELATAMGGRQAFIPAAIQKLEAKYGRPALVAAWDAAQGPGGHRYPAGVSDSRTMAAWGRGDFVARRKEAVEKLKALAGATPKPAPAAAQVSTPAASEMVESPAMGSSLHELRVARVKANERLQQFLGRPFTSQLANAAIRAYRDGNPEEANRLVARATPEEKQEMQAIAEELNSAEKPYLDHIAAINNKKEAWQLTKEESEHPITYSNMQQGLQIGDERVFYRVGNLPPGNRSMNTMTGRREEGVSVYNTAASGSIAGEVERPWYYGRGKVVGWGGDDEPIIEPTGDWAKYPGHKKVVEQALKDGKPVPPEVLKDYPALAKKYGKPPVSPQPAAARATAPAGAVAAVEAAHRRAAGKLKGILGTALDNTDGTPGDLAQQLAIGYRDQYALGHPPRDAEAVASLLRSLGAQQVGTPGESAEFDGAVHENIPGAFTGHPVKVKRPGWVLPGPGGADRVLVKTAVERA